MTILDFLVQKKLIEQDDIGKIEGEMRTGEITLEEALIRHGVLPTDFLSAKSEYYKVPIKNMTNVDVPFDILKYIPE